MNPQDKLSALEEILGVDDTEEIARPEPRRSISEILEGDSTPRPVADPPTAVPDEDAPVSGSGAAPAIRVPRKRPAVSKAPKTRSSSLLPTSFVARFGAAKQARWDFALLVESALKRPSPSESQAESWLASFEDEPRSLRSFTLETNTVALLDDLGHDWRMNRSQVLTVLLSRELAKLDF